MKHLITASITRERDMMRVLVNFPEGVIEVKLLGGHNEEALEIVGKIASSSKSMEGLTTLLDDIEQKERRKGRQIHAHLLMRTCKIEPKATNETNFKYEEFHSISSWY